MSDVFVGVVEDDDVVVVVVVVVGVGESRIEETSEADTWPCVRFPSVETHSFPAIPTIHRPASSPVCVTLKAGFRFTPADGPAEKPRKRAGLRGIASRARRAASGEGNVRWKVAVAGGGAVVFDGGSGVKMMGCFVTLRKS